MRNRENIKFLIVVPSAAVLLLLQTLRQAGSRWKDSLIARVEGGAHEEDGGDAAVFGFQGLMGGQRPGSCAGSYRGRQWECMAE